MLNKLSNQRGISLIEVVVASGLGVFLLSAVAVQFLGFTVLTSDISRQDQLKRLVSMNVAEINLLPSSELPAPGYCKVRRYDGQEKLISTIEKKVPSCKSSLLENGEKEIVWIVSSFDKKQSQFSHPNVMKLPVRSELLQVDVQASAKAANGTDIKTVVFTLFKG